MSFAKLFENYKAKIATSKVIIISFLLSQFKNENSTCYWGIM
jgi:hypothetical protein